MYNIKVPIHKVEIINSITKYIIPVDFCQNNDHVIIFTTDDMRSKFEAFSKNEMDAIYLTEVMRKE